MCNIVFCIVTYIKIIKSHSFPNKKLPNSSLHLLPQIDHFKPKDAYLMTSRFGNSMLVCMWYCIIPGPLANGDRPSELGLEAGSL